MPPSPPLHLAAAVFVGGAAGAFARSAMSVAAGFSPWMTLAENTVGCLLLGLLLGVLRRRSAPDWLIAGLGTGALGGFTSMSALAADTGTLLQAAPLLAALYLVLTVGAGLAAARAGFGWGARAPHSVNPPGGGAP